jgi:hypothetical protein
LHQLKSLAVVALVVISATLSTVSASAQAGGDADPGQITTPGNRAKGNIAGTVGLGLLGAEVGLLLAPAVGLHEHWWAWALFPTIGAAGGVVAGVLAFDEGDPGLKVTAPLLGAGIALVLPAIVGSLAIKNRRQHGPLEKRVNVSGSLVNLERGERRLSVPSVASVPVYGAREVQRLGAVQRNAWRISLVSGRF